MENAETSDQNGTTHYTNGLVNGFHTLQSDNGECISSNGGGLGASDSSGGHNGIENFHHLHQDVHNNGSPAKRCRLRRRVDSGKKNRPRKFSVFHDFLAMLLKLNNDN